MKKKSIKTLVVTKNNLSNILIDDNLLKTLEKNKFDLKTKHLANLLKVEIDKAGWFNFKDLPQVPTGNISISGKLIESYIEKLNG